ncbi:NSFL1 cofactor p47 [Acipenser ruthenus]|uniref:NSFL1 cofactor p47 n=1 Tax=Acipenser ruthenus TaxID=7906 RepID=A0A444UQT3_ACIRT|nr:NSFL1 cofactor p47 [Acipenser ruthenus]
MEDHRDEDFSKPKTSFRAFTGEGQKLGRVSDVRQFILGARPSMAAAEFVLMTTFPNKELADESQTLKDANLLNAVIVQRLK